MKEALFMEQFLPKVTTGPVDLDAAANTGERFDMQKFKRVAFIIVAAAGTTPDSHTVSLQQHTVATSGTPAALAIANPWFHKVNAETSFTKVDVDVAASSFDIDAIVGDTKFVAVFEVLQENLTDGYRWVSLNMTDAGGAQLGTVIAIGFDATEKPTYGKVV